jgi:hypothetical protein
MLNPEVGTDRSLHDAGVWLQKCAAGDISALQATGPGWVPADDVVLILAVRHQLEAGYKEE